MAAVDTGTEDLLADITDGVGTLTLNRLVNCSLCTNGTVTRSRHAFYVATRTKAFACSRQDDATNAVINLPRRQHFC